MYSASPSSSLSLSLCQRQQERRSKIIYQSHLLFCRETGAEAGVQLRAWDAVSAEREREHFCQEDEGDNEQRAMGVACKPLHQRRRLKEKRSTGEQERGRVREIYARNYAGSLVVAAIPSSHHEQ